MLRKHSKCFFLHFFPFHSILIQHYMLRACFVSFPFGGVFCVRMLTRRVNASHLSARFFFVNLGWHFFILFVQILYIRIAFQIKWRHSFNSHIHISSKHTHITYKHGQTIHTRAANLHVFNRTGTKRHIKRNSPNKKRSQVCPFVFRGKAKGRVCKKIYHNLKTKENWVLQTKHSFDYSSLSPFSPLNELRAAMTNNRFRLIWTRQAKYIRWK